MLIELRKFGDILTSREAGGEALSAFMPTLSSLMEDEKIQIDFQGVSVLTPSWADEFISPLLKKYGKNVSFIHDENPSVQSALQFADPNLDLSNVYVFSSWLVFNEKTDYEIHNGNKAWTILAFPYNDHDAVCMLKNNQVKEIHVHPVDLLKNSPRLKSVIEMLEHAGIKILSEATPPPRSTCP